MARTGLAWCHPPVVRFWAQVAKKGPQDCWEWLGSLVGDGRGRLRVKGQNVYAHRFAYELLVEPIPDGSQVLHTCDNPKCVNPKHLSLGDTSANMKDAYAKGRKSNVGKKNPNAKLTETQVREIRARYEKEGPAALSREFEVSRYAIMDVHFRRKWGHLC